MANDPNPEKDLALRILRHTNTHLFLTGRAGTGKTTFLKQLPKLIYKRMIVVAPTGIAAINAGGVTIHSFFQLPFGSHLPTRRQSESKFAMSDAKKKLIRSLDLLVIDEISMVRADLLDAIDEVLRRHRDRHRPFGGVQLLMIGDLNQLAPIVSDDERRELSAHYATEFFFSSRALAECRWVSVELKRVYRQRDENFVTLLNAVRDNRLTTEQLQRLNQCYRAEMTAAEQEGYVRLVTHNQQADDINDRALGELPGEALTYEAKVSGKFPESSYPMAASVVLKKGAQVMFTKNDKGNERAYFNGMLAVVEELTAETVTVRSKEHGTIIEVKAQSWQNIRYKLNDESKEIEELVEGTFTQMPLRAAWAITIHKSQGLTFDRAIVNLSGAFAHGQAYVALSRCKSMEGLVLSAPISTEEVIQSGVVRNFHHELSQQLPQESEIADMEQVFVVQCLDECFGMNGLDEALRKFMRVLEEFFYKQRPMLVADFLQLQENFELRVRNVIPRFQQQYRQLLAQTNNGDDAQLQERVRKAATYYNTELSLLFRALKEASVSSNSNEAQQRATRTRNELLALIRRYLFLLRNIEQRGFLLQEFLKWRVLADDAKLDEDKAETPSATSQKATATRKNALKRSSADKTKRAAQGTSTDVTIDLFAEGMSRNEIAQQRKVTMQTVATHLSAGLENGRICIEQLVEPAVLEQVRAYLSQHPEAQALRPIFEAFGGEISYDDLRFVIADWKARRA